MRATCWVLLLVVWVASTASAADYTFRKIADTSPESNLALVGGRVAINNQGVVVFAAQHKDTVASPRENVIYVGSGGDLTRIAGSNGPINEFLPTSINNSGTVVFGAILDNLTTAIYTGSGGELTTIATSSTVDYHPQTANASINDQGLITHLVGNGTNWRASPAVLPGYFPTPPILALQVA